MLKRFMIPVLLLIGSCSQKPIEPQLIQNAENECTAYGHGPYDLDEERCRELAINQARTNCSLSDKDSEVEFFGFEWQSKGVKKEFSGRCRNHLSDNGDCEHQGCD